MMTDSDWSAATWHGFPRVLPRELLLSASDALGRIWRNQGGDDAGTTSPGLTRWFDPLARGARLRDQLADLKQVVVFSERDRAVGTADVLREPFVLDVDGGRLLVTPEGLGLMRVLRAAGGEPPPTVSLAWELTDSADHFILAFYRQESMKRIKSVVQLQRGDGPPLLPAAVGLVLLLILNGNTVRQRGLRPEERSLPEVDRAIAEVTRAFVDALGLRDSGKSVSDAAFSLSSGYALTEAKRRLGTDLTIDDVGIADGARSRVITRLADELARRRDLDARVVESAVLALGAAYDRNRPTLAAHGVANGIPGQGPALASEVVEAFSSARAGGKGV